MVHYPEIRSFADFFWVIHDDSPKNKRHSSVPGTRGNITREGPAAWDKEAVCPAEYQGPLGGCIGEICEGKTCVFRSLSSVPSSKNIKKMRITWLMGIKPSFFWGGCNNMGLMG